MLCRGGPNAIALALIGLGWWLGASSASDDTADVRLAITDVAWAMKNMNQKRTRAEETSEGASNKRRRVGT